MQQSFYVYNNGDLKRKDNTLRFTSYDGEKRKIFFSGCLMRVAFLISRMYLL